MQPPISKEWSAEPAPERPGSWAFQLALCLLGPLFFLSYLLSLLSPLPLLYLYVSTPRNGRLWSAAAVVIGFAITASIKGPGGALGFLLLSVVPALILGETLLRRKGLEAAVGAALAGILVTTALAAGAASLVGLDLLAEGKGAVDTQVKMVAENLLSGNQELPTETRQELEKIAQDPSVLYPELPGMFASALMLLCILPALALIRWNPKGFLRRTAIGRDYLRKWRAPDWLVWAALASGALHLFEAGFFTDLARNALKPLLLIYFFQGMSILAYFLDSLRLRGPIRVLVYGLGTLFLTPMVVSFGFFDLWFNFRGRHRPKVEEKEP